MFWVAGGEGAGAGWMGLLLLLLKLLLLAGKGEGGHVALFADVAVFEAEAGLPVGALLFGQAEVDEHAAPLHVVVEEVCGFDVAVEDAGAVDRVQGREEGVEVVAHVRDKEFAVVEAEVEVAEVGEHGDDLVEVTEGGEEGADVGGGAERVEDLEFVLDAVRRGCDVDLLEGDVLGLGLWIGSDDLGCLLGGGRG